ncbi:Uncharacterised protein [Bordetella pertussis]|nr:Uncharacterised protein [Bordetella pertussis]
MVMATAMPLMASCSWISPSFRSRPAISICMLLGVLTVPLTMACAVPVIAPAVASAALPGTSVLWTEPPTRFSKLKWLSLPRMTRALKPLMVT